MLHFGGLYCEKEEEEERDIFLVIYWSLLDLGILIADLEDEGMARGMLWWI